MAGSSPPPHADSGNSGTVKRGTSPSPALVSSAPYWRDTSRDDLVGHPVEDGDERGVVLLGGTQQMPGHRVGVPGGRGDHDPDVGRADQFGGEHPVVGHEGVDVGRVEEGEPAREGVGGLDAQHARVVLARQQWIVPGVLLGHPHAREVGQYAHPAEPVMVLRVAHEHRSARRGPQYPGLADPPSHKGVDQCRLAGPGRSSDHGEQGCFGFSQAGARDSRRAARAVRRGWHARVEPPPGAAGSVRRRHGRAGRKVRRAAEAVRPRSPHAKNAQFWGLSEAYEHVCAPIGHTGTEGTTWGAGITSAQHPGRETPKAMHDSHLPAIIRTASLNLHIEPRRRSTRDRDPGALSLSPARSRTRPHPGTSTTGHHTRPP